MARAVGSGYGNIISKCNAEVRIIGIGSKECQSNTQSGSADIYIDGEQFVCLVICGHNTIQEQLRKQLLETRRLARSK